MSRIDHERRRQIAVGGGVLLGITLIVCGTLIGWRHLPGLLGDWLGVVVGVMTTPFFLEASFAVLGLTVVLVLNHWRQKREGDELVVLEQVDEPGLPEHASWAVFRKPLDGESPSLLVQAEGALAIRDYGVVVECLAAMPEEDLKRPEVLALRLELARETERGERVAELEEQIRALHPAQGVNLNTT